MRKLLQSAAARQKNFKTVALCVSTRQSELSRLHKEFEFPIFKSGTCHAHLNLDQESKHGSICR
jgi:hypothetical protein